MAELVIIGLIVLITVTLLAPRLVTGLYAKSRTYQTVEAAPKHRIAIVFGAGLWRDGRPTPVLRDRVEMAAQLYFAGKVQKLLMSGDNRYANYNEPRAMYDYAIDLGIPGEAIVLDYAGRRTYDTCYRAKYIFALSDAILVTQSFHLPRTIYTCNHLGLEAVGIPSNLRTYRFLSSAYWNLRELIATLTALIEIHITHPLPVLGDPEPISFVEVP